MRTRSAIRQWLWRRFVVFAVLWPAFVLVLATEVEREDLGPTPIASAVRLTLFVGLLTLFGVAHYSVITGVGHWLDRRFLYQPAWYRVRRWRRIPGVMIQDLIEKLKLLAAVAWLLPWLLLPLAFVPEEIDWISAVQLAVTLKLLGLLAYVAGWTLLCAFGRYEYKRVRIMHHG